MAVNPEEVRKHFRGERYMPALQMAWQLPQRFSYRDLGHDKVPLRELVVSACREAVTQAEQEMKHVESQQWLSSFLNDFTLPDGFKEYYEGQDSNSAVAYLSTRIYAYFRCTKVVLDCPWTSTTVAPAALRPVADKTGLPLGFLRDLVQELLPEVPGGPQYRPAVDTCTLAVLLVDEARNEGVVADLTLERLPDGTGDLYPVPELSFVYGDDAWQQAMRDAPAYVQPTLWQPVWDVRWRLARRDQQPLPPVLGGGSLGAALALGLTKLADGAKDLDLQGIAITATVDAQGQLGKIEGEFPKLLAVVRERTLPHIHTVVVAEAQRQDVKDIDASLLRDDPHAGLHIICAETLKDAIQLLEVNAETRWRNIDCALPSRHPHFVGRARLTEAVRHFVARQEAGYLILVGGMGQGKSTWLAELIHAEQARGEEPIYHFIDYHPSATGEPRGLAACLYDRLRRKYAFLAPQEWGHLSVEIKLERLLKHISATELRDGQKEVLYIDAADQAEASMQVPLLPGVLRHLPRGVVGVITSRAHLDWLRTVQAVTVWEMADYVDDRVDVQAYLQQRSRHLSPPLPTAFIERIVTQPEPPIFFTVAQRLRYLEDLTLPQSDQTALRTDPALWVLPAEELIQTEALRMVTESEARGMSEMQVWQTLGMLAVAGEHLSEAHLEALGLWQAGTTDRILKLAANFFRPRLLVRQPALLYQFDHPGYLREVLRHLHEGDITHLHGLLAQGCERCWRDPRSVAQLYALRHHVAHLVAAQNWPEVVRTFADIDYVVERSERFTFTDVYADALAAVQATSLTPAWRDVFGAWERFLRWRIERLRHFPVAYAQEVRNEFLPTAPSCFIDAWTSWPGGSSSGLFLRKTFGPASLSATDHQGKVRSLVWAPDGHTLASASSDGTVKLWDAHGQLLVDCVGHQDEVESVAWAPDGRTLASASSDGTVKLWDAHGQFLADCVGHDNEMRSVAWAPDGRPLAFGGSDWMVKLCDTQRGELFAERVGQSEVWSVAWAPDGRRLALGCWDGTVKIWDAQQEEFLTECVAYRKAVLSMAWAPDGRRLASGSQDGTVKIWDTHSRRLLANRGGQSEVWSVAWAPDGCKLALGGEDGTVKIWDAQPGRLLANRGDHVGYHVGNHDKVASVAWTTDGRRLALMGQDGAVEIWDAQCGQPLTNRGELHMGPIYTHMGPIWDPGVRMAWAPDGRRLVLGGQDRMGSGRQYGTVKIWDTHSGRLLANYVGHQEEVLSMMWAPDGRRLASGSQDGTVKIWDTHSRKCLANCVGHQREVESVAWAPDGRFVASCSRDGTVKIWDTSSGQCMTTLFFAPEPIAVAFFPGQPLCLVIADRGGRFFGYELVG